MWTAGQINQRWNNGQITVRDMAADNVITRAVLGALFEDGVGSFQLRECWLLRCDPYILLSTRVDSLSRFVNE